MVVFGCAPQSGTIHSRPLQAPSGMAAGKLPPSAKLPPLPTCVAPPAAEPPVVLLMAAAAAVPLLGLTVLSLPAGEHENINEATETIDPRTAMRRMLVAFIRFFMAKPGPWIHAHPKA